MAAEPDIAGFSATDQLTLGGDWVAQSDNLTPQTTTIMGQGADGDEVARASIDSKTTGSNVFKCFATGGNLTFPNVGAVSNGYHIDDWSCAFSPTDWPVLTVNFHKHTANDHASENEFACPLTIANGKGVPVILADAGSVAGRRSASVSLAATHVDELDGDGTHLAGATVNGQLTVELEHTGIPNLSAAAATAGLTLESTSTDGSNAAFDVVKTRYTKAVTREA